MVWDDDNTNAEIALLLLVLQIAYSLTKPNIIEERVSTDNIEIIFYIIQNVNPIYNECRLTTYEIPFQILEVTILPPVYNSKFNPESYSTTFIIFLFHPING